MCTAETSGRGEGIGLTGVVVSCSLGLETVTVLFLEDLEGGDRSLSGTFQGVP